MIYSITGSKDATIYNYYDLSSTPDRREQNTGYDEILELKKYIKTNSTALYSRILLKFDLNDISSSIVSGDINNSNAIWKLQLTEAKAKEIPLSYTINCYPVSQSWEMGVGTYNDSPIDDVGVSWKYRDSKDIGTYWQTSSLATGTTGSSTGGGTWYTSSYATQNFEYQSKDIDFTVTDIINDWLDESKTNDGFIIKWDDNYEYDASNLGEIGFYSKETHTIYPPKLQVRWDDSSFITGSLTELTDEDMIVIIKNMKEEYHLNSKIKFRIIGRERYISRTYTTAFTGSSTTTYIPTSSYYSIFDMQSGKTIIPFSDNYTKISCDSTGNYFNLWLDQFDVNRYYGVNIKIVNTNGTNYYKNEHIFKVVT